MKLHNASSYNFKHRLQYITDITLVELMVALAISSVMMLGIATVFTGSKRNYVVQDEFARLQENARFVMSGLSIAIRDAGNTGCASGSFGPITNRLDVADPAYQQILHNFAVGLEGYEATSTGPGVTYDMAAPPATTTWITAGGANITASGAAGTAIAGGLALPGSDILVARSRTGLNVEVARNNDAGNLFGTDAGGGVAAGCSNGICRGDILMISDCQKARVFQANNIAGGPPGEFNIVHAVGGPTPPGNTPPGAWGGANATDTFAPGSEIMKVMSKIYFVGTGANGGPALFLQNGAAAPQELVEGVESMQLLYGIDTDATPDGVANQFVTANNVPVVLGTNLFDNVVSVKLSLLMSSVNNVIRTANAAKTNILMSGTTVASAVTMTLPLDSRIRKVFSSTIKIRNRGI